MKATIGIIGGSGLYELDAMENVQKVDIETPFGPTSDSLILGTFKGIDVVFVPRHGKGHRHLPKEVPYRANIYALKKLGVEFVVSVSAVGSLREEFAPGNFALPDQYVDRTSGRTQTFFGDGIVSHVSMADPTSPVLRELIEASVNSCDITLHNKGTYICMEGPAFSTRAESELYRQWGMDIIGMTAMPEVKLAREAELRYATLALVTDYDCWRVEEEAVSVEAVMAILKQNTANVKRVLSDLIPRLGQAVQQGTSCPVTDGAMKYAVITSKELIPKDRLADLEPLICRYVS